MQQQMNHRDAAFANFKKRLSAQAYFRIPYHSYTVPIRELLGSTWEQAFEHFESQRRSGMHWRHWHTIDIDHIIPASWFVPMHEEWQQRACFDYRNLRPEWASLNRQRSARRNLLAMVSDWISLHDHHELRKWILCQERKISSS